MVIYRVKGLSEAYKNSTWVQFCTHVGFNLINVQKSMFSGFFFHGNQIWVMKGIMLLKKGFRTIKHHFFFNTVKNTNQWYGSIIRRILFVITLIYWDYFSKVKFGRIYAVFNSYNSETTAAHPPYCSYSKSSPPKKMRSRKITDYAPHGQSEIVFLLR